MADEIQQTEPENGEGFEKKKRKPSRSNELKGGLNINSMMDIMTILLVFLLIMNVIAIVLRRKFERRW